MATLIPFNSATVFAEGEVAVAKWLAYVESIDRENKAYVTRKKAEYQAEAWLYRALVSLDLYIPWQAIRLPVKSPLDDLNRLRRAAEIAIESGQKRMLVDSADLCTLIRWSRRPTQ